MDYYITLPGKKCSKCNNKESIFIIKDGYLICSNCGFIVLSYIPGIDFKPVGFYKKPKNMEELIKKFKKERPDILEDDLLYKLELFVNMPEKEIRRAIKLYEIKRKKRNKTQ